MTTATFIQGVPWWPQRTRNAVELARATGGQVIWDSTSCGLDTFKDVLRAMGNAPGILMEDDVALAPRWREQVEEVIAAHPREVVRFFDLDLDESARRLGSRAMAGKDFALNQCVYYPATYAAQQLAYMGDTRSKFYLEHHDCVLARWLHARRETFWNHVPSLVQHRPFPSTIMPGRSRHRQSPIFGAADAHH